MIMAAIVCIVVLTTIAVTVGTQAGSGWDSVTSGGNPSGRS
jgi:hypothetical protein